MIQQKNSYDVIIVGAGVVGLALAVALAQQGLQIAIVEKKIPILNWNENDWDARVSAINQASFRYLNAISVWPSVAKNSYCSFERMHVWDHMGGGVLNFAAQDIPCNELGYIVENRALIKTLWETLQNYPNVIFYAPSESIALQTYETHTELELSDSKINAPLLIGADGPNSWVRQQMKFSLTEKPYGHDSLIAVLKTEKPHHHTAYQNFMPKGPLALLPLYNDHQVALVWSTQTEDAHYLFDLPEEAFEREVSNGSNLCLGSLKLDTKINKITLIERNVKNYIQNRIALIGDAAHTIHPLAGQGVNLGLMDAACLAECIIDEKNKHRDFGATRTLRRYERWRKADHQAMLKAMKFFQKIFATESPALVQARTFGINITNKTTFLKNYFMRYAMGNVPDQPKLIQNEEKV